MSFAARNVIDKGYPKNTRSVVSKPIQVFRLQSYLFVKILVALRNSRVATATLHI